MSATAVCVLFLLKLKWPKSKNFYDNQRGKRILARAFPVWPAKWRVLRMAACHSAWRIDN